MAIGLSADTKFRRFSKQKFPPVIAQINNFQVKSVKAFGKFVWHKHDDTDEFEVLKQGLCIGWWKAGQTA